MSEGERGAFVVVIEHGQVKVVVADPAGRLHLLGLSGPGELLGELACLDNGERVATVVAVSTVQAVHVLRARFLELIDTVPGIAREVACSIGSRLRTAHRLRVDLSPSEVAGRVAYVLGDAARYFVRLGAGASVVVPLTQDEVAQLANCSVVAVQRALRTMRKAGLVSTGYGQLRIPCTHCLSRYATVVTKRAETSAKPVTGCGGRDAHRGG